MEFLMPHFLVQGQCIGRSECGEWGRRRRLDGVLWVVDICEGWVWVDKVGRWSLSR